MKKLFCMMMAVLFVAVPAAALKGDVVNPEDLPYVPTEGSPSSWAVSEITQAAAAGLVPELTGNPGYQDKLTREQFAELVVCMMSAALDKQLPAAEAGTFSDTENKAVLQANQAGVVDGVGQGRFAPKETTNREQVATMMFRAISVLEKETGKDLTPVAGSMDKFTDKARVSSWAAEAVGVLAANSIMKGTSETQLSPAGSCTVEQGVLLCFRVYQQLSGK